MPVASSSKPNARTMVRVGLKSFSSKVSTDELLGINLISAVGEGPTPHTICQSIHSCHRCFLFPRWTRLWKTILSSLAHEDVTSVYHHNVQNRGDISTGRRSWGRQEQRLSKGIKLSDCHRSAAKPTLMSG